MGCKTNCTNGLVPIKWDKVLNTCPLITDVIFIKKCCVRNITKNNPDKAIKSFLPIDDLTREMIDIYNFLIFKIKG